MWIIYWVRSDQHICWLWPENEVRSYQGKWAITDTERRFGNAIYVTPSTHIEFNSPWDLGGLSPVYECSLHPRESVWQILCKLSLLGQTHPRWLCQTAPHPQYCKKNSNDLFVIVLLFLTTPWRGTSHSSRCHKPRTAAEFWDSWGSSWCQLLARHSSWRQIRINILISSRANSVYDVWQDSGLTCPPASHTSQTWQQKPHPSPSYCIS